MSIAPLVAILAAVVVVPVQDPNPAVLVTKLGSAEPAERAAAANSLKALGRRALPALEGATKVSEAGVRERASALWETISRDLMIRPSLVRLGGANQTLSRELEDLGAQTGLTLERESNTQDKHVTLTDPDQVSFWTTLERLGLWGIFYQNPGEGRFPKLLLREAPAPAFTSTAGPFRVFLIGLHLHHDRQLIGGPWARIDQSGQRINIPAQERENDSDTFFGEIEIMVEPRMWFTQEAPALLTEARDDLGQSLVPAPAELAAILKTKVPFAFYAGSGVAQMRTEFHVRVTDRPGRVASQLCGVVPVMLHVRRPEPMLVIPLSGAAGKTFRCDDAEFTIGTVNDSPTATNVSLTIRLNVDKAGLTANPERQVISSRLFMMGEHQLQLTDDGGKVLAYSISSGSGGGDTPSLFQCTMATFQNGRATQLRYYGMLRVRSEAAFDFRNVPLP